MSTEKKKTRQNRQITSFADAVKYVLQLFGEIKFLTVFRTMLIVINIIVVIFLYNVVSSQQMVEKIIDGIVTTDKEERLNMNIRDQVSPQISSYLSRLLYVLDADHSFIIELHNGKKNATSLPFKYYDMTYEEVNDERNTPFVSDSYTNAMVSHYKLPYWLADNTTFIGTTEELSEIDPRFASNMASQNGKYLGMMILRSRGQNIGFIGVSYDHEEYIKDVKVIENKLEEYAKIMAPLLDLGLCKSKININEDDE